MDGDTQKIAEMLLAKRKAGKPGDRVSEYKPDVPAQPAREDEEIDGRHLAAEHMLTAYREGSAEKLSSAMEAWMHIHNSKAEDESASG
jgi:hypothetical protein